MEPVGLPWKLATLVILALAALPSTVQAEPLPEEKVRDRLIAQDSEVCRNAVAAAGSDATCTVLYAHLFALLQGVPLTTQPPTNACPDLAKGFTTFPAFPPLFDTASMDLWTMVGPIEYPRVGCEARLRPERGLAFEVRLDPRVALAFHWFLSADTDDVSLLVDPSEPDTGAMPCVEVRVTLQTGRVFGQGTVLAQGSARRTVLSSNVAEPRRLPQFDPCAEGDLVLAHHPFLEVAPVHEFPVSLSPVGQPLPRDEGFVVRVEWSQVRDGPVEANQREWNVHSGADYRNRLVVPVVSPLRMAPPHVERYGQHHLIINASVQSPWGTYDVDVDSIRLDVLDANGFVIPPRSLTGPLLGYSTDHHANVHPVNATWAWDFLKAQSSPGPYTVRVSASNSQHTDTLVQETVVDLPQFMVRPSPSLGAPLLVLGLAVALLLSRRI